MLRPLPSTFSEASTLVVTPKRRNARVRLCGATPITTKLNKIAISRLPKAIGTEAGIPGLPKCAIRLGDIAVSIPRDNHPGALEYDFGKYEPGGTFDLKGSLDRPPLVLISADRPSEEDEMTSRDPLRRILKNITKQPEYARPNSSDVLLDQTFHRANKGSDCGIRFEREAAGIVGEIPCLVVRGICDYADTHNQDGRHYYAATVAAA